MRAPQQCTHPVGHQVLDVDGAVCYQDTRQLRAPVEFDTGTGAAPDAVDTCSRLMLVDELATVTTDWAHAYKCGAVDTKCHVLVLR